MSGEHGDLLELLDTHATLLHRWRLPIDDTPPAVLGDLSRRIGGVIIPCYAPGGAGIIVNTSAPTNSWATIISHEIAHWMEGMSQHTPRQIALSGALLLDAWLGCSDMDADEARRECRRITAAQWRENRQQFFPGLSELIEPLVVSAAIDAADAAGGRGAVALQEAVAQRLPWWTGIAAWVDHWAATAWLPLAVAGGILYYLS